MKLNVGKEGLNCEFVTYFCKAMDDQNSGGGTKRVELVEEDLGNEPETESINIKQTLKSLINITIIQLNAETFLYLLLFEAYWSNCCLQCTW